jgi:DNA polymerase III, gamma/tau subunits
MLSNIIGQETIKRFLATEMRNDALSHGYIIDGPKFMGKSFIAKEVAEEITVSSYITEVLPTEDRKYIQVDDIRALKEDAYSSSFKGAKKVYIIPNADKMTVSAQNAFLKVLEEPPQDCIFILLTEDRMQLLETVRSRCTALVLSRYKDSEIAQYLQTLNLIADNEIIRLCNGALNRYAYYNSTEMEPVTELTFRILLHIQELHPARVFAITKHVKKMKDRLDDILDLFLIFYRDVYVYKLLQDAGQVELQSKIDSITKLSSVYTEENLIKIIDKILFTKVKLHANCNLDFSFETLLLVMRGVV